MPKMGLRCAQKGRAQAKFFLVASAVGFAGARVGLLGKQERG